MSPVRLSLNEVEVTVRKAGIGCGLPVGYAEDLGAAAAWLCRARLDGVEAAVADLEAWQAGHTGRSVATRTETGWRLDGQARVPLAGWFAAPTAADLARLCAPGQAVALAAVAAPLLVLGALGCATALPGPCFRLSWAGGAASLCADRAGFEAGDARSLTGSAPLALRVAPADTATEPREPLARTPPEHGVPVGRTLYARLDALARLTLVPESEASRARGAGAGLRDSD